MKLVYSRKILFVEMFQEINKFLNKDVFCNYLIKFHFQLVTFEQIRPKILFESLRKILSREANEFR